MLYIYLSAPSFVSERANSAAISNDVCRTGLGYGSVLGLPVVGVVVRPVQSRTRPEFESQSESLHALSRYETDGPSVAAV